MSHVARHQAATVPFTLKLRWWPKTKVLPQRTVYSPSVHDTIELPKLDRVEVQDIQVNNMPHGRRPIQFTEATTMGWVQI